MVIFSSSKALDNISIITFGDNLSRTTTLQRLISAVFTLKEGFSVVAPIRVIVPSSTCGSKASVTKKNQQLRKKNYVVRGSHLV